MSKENNVWGIEPLTCEIPANVMHNLQKFHEYKTRNLPAAMKPKLEDVALSYIAEQAQKMAEYAEAAAYKALEKIVFDAAKKLNITPVEAATKFGIQLKEN